MVEWAALLVGIRFVPGSNLGLDSSDCPDSSFPGFSFVFSDKCRDGPPQINTAFFHLNFLILLRSKYPFRDEAPT
jgi:hypothetical protein